MAEACVTGSGRSHEIDMTSPEPGTRWAERLQEHEDRIPQRSQPSDSPMGLPVHRPAHGAFQLSVSSELGTGNLRATIPATSKTDPNTQTINGPVGKSN